MAGSFHRVGFGLVLGCLVAAGVLGCAAVTPRLVPESAAAADKALVPGIPTARLWGDSEASDLNVLIDRHGRMLRRHAASSKVVNGIPQVYILAISGGGSGGAFGAGLLKGWSAQGGRPRFNVVTGVSAGAIIAPFAFLGPAYDHQLEQIWTQYETSELLVAQVLPAILGGPALADTAPLRALIDKYVDHRFLRAVAAEHARGRLLLVGTTNLDAQRPVYWNMGEIATSSAPHKLQLFRDVIMASAAIPGAFPPVSIQVESEGRLVEELHVDGGTTRDVFVAPLQLKLSSLDRLYSVPPKRHIFIIVNGKTTPEFKAVSPTAVAIGARAVSTLIKSHDGGDLYRIAQQAAESGAEFKVVSIPATFLEEPKQAFDPVYQRALFELGEGLGFQGGGWRSSLPTKALPAGLTR